MSDKDAFLQAIVQAPNDTNLRLIFADFLEERDDPRGELLRLLHILTQSIEVPERDQLEERLRSLIESGVKPIGPFITNSIGMTFALIPPGTFLMGSPKNEEGHHEDETQHKVTLTKGYYLAIHPVTQASWKEVMGDNPSHFNGDDLPVGMISWEDCQRFLRYSAERDHNLYRLPTKAEWEFACRAGTTTPFNFGKTISIDQANYKDSQRGTTTEGSYLPNGWGLYDMHGNVMEWCADKFALSTYLEEDAVDPQGPEEGQVLVLRGGTFGFDASKIRSAYRYLLRPESRYADVGFRPVMIITS